MIAERATIMENNIRVRMLGRRDGIPDQVLAELDKTVAMSQANSGTWLNLAINYGGRAELVDAMRKIAERVAAGELAPDDIQRRNDLRATLHGRGPRSRPVDPHGRRDADQQLSALADQLRGNLGDRQIWPEFDEATLHEAIRAYAARERRFGGLNQ